MTTTEPSTPPRTHPRDVPSRTHPTRTHPNFLDKHAMFELLRDHIERNPDGTCTYHADWSDSRIATAINPTFKAHHAGAIRRAEFGNLSKTKEPSRPTVWINAALVEARLTRLEEQVERLVDHIVGGSPSSPAYRRRLLEGPTAPASLDDIA